MPGSGSEDTKEKIEQSFVKKIINSSAVGTTQLLYTFGLGHPFDLLKTRMQANPAISSGILLSKEIYQSSGIRGFYTAGVPNFSRALLKEVYRHPARGFFKKAYSDLTPHDLDKNYPSLKNTATGLTMACTDTFILCPLERIKVWLMTNYEKKRKLLHLFDPSKTDLPLFSNLFRGLKVSFARNAITWTSYLIAEEEIRRLVIAHSPRIGSSPDPLVPFPEQLLIGTLAGITNCLTTLPLDSVKTHIQKSGSIEKAEILKTMKEIVEKHGVKGLYSGWTFRLPHYILMALITSSNIQVVDKIWGVRPSPK